MLRYEHGGNVYDNKGVILDFSTNLHPFGMPKEVAESIDLGACSRYPDPACGELCEALSRHEGVAREHILCGNGASDLIYRLCFGLKPKKVLVCAPTFSDYERAVRLSGGEVVYHRLNEANGFLLTEKILDDATNIDMLFLCNPNNPTGRLVTADLIERVAEHCAKKDIMLVIDECFLEFTDAKSAKNLLNEYNNIVILKAFTKTYAMAGLRLGYILTRSENAMKAAREFAQPWSVSALAQAAGVAALTCPDWTLKVRELIAAERKYLIESLCGLGVKTYRSDANFLLLKSAKPLYPLLLPRGILVRSCENYEGLDEKYTRICIKTHEENKELIKAVKEVLNG